MESLQERHLWIPRKAVFRSVRNLLDVLKGPYRPSDLSSDVLAGITVGLIALPLALALGIASLPASEATPFPAPALGIFTAIIAGLIISLLGGSKVQIGGPTAAFIPIILLIVERHGYGGLLVATMMAGVILVVMGITRMGVLIKYIPWPVTSGFHHRYCSIHHRDAGLGLPWTAGVRPLLRREFIEKLSVDRGAPAYPQWMDVWAGAGCVSC
jgi:hypothetical protein